MHKHKRTAFFELLAIAFNDLKKNDPLRLAGATAFFTTFALPPILIILVQVIGLIFQREDLRETFFVRLADLLGNDSAKQIMSTFLGFKSLATNWVFAIGGSVFLMFVATTLFKVIKDSLNQLWNLKAVDTKKIKVQLQSRFISMIVILLAGVLFIGGMLADGLEAFLHQYTGVLHPKTAGFLNTTINHLISAVIVSTWFAVLFKVLPDGKVSWKVVAGGGIFTGIFFSFGKIIIHALLTAGNLTTIFGASTSFVLLLLFVFYSSFILYYGACFTKAYALYLNEPVEPALHSVKYKVVEVKGE